MATGRSARVRTLALVGVAALGLAACGSSGKSSSSATTAAAGSSGGGGTVKLGFFGALTGANAQLGINIENGENLAIAQYMATNPKTKVVIDAFDSQGQASQAPTGAQKMINDKVVAVIGPAFSGESASADPIFEQAGIPNISASATNVKLAQNGWKYFHRVVAADDAQGPGDANYLVNTLGHKTVAVIDDSSTYGEGLGNYVRTQLKTNGGQDVVDDHVDPNGQDYSATVNKIVAAKPQAVFYGGYYDAAGRLIKQLKDAGFTGTFMSGDGSEDPGFIKDAGGAAAEGAYLSCACEDTTKAANAQAFNSAYQAKFGGPPLIYSGEGYDATNFVLAAIKAGNTTPKAVNDYLASNSWNGVTKTIKFLSDGNIAGGTIFVYKVENGTITQIGTTH